MRSRCPQATSASIWQQAAALELSSGVWKDGRAVSAQRQVVGQGDGKEGKSNCEGRRWSRPSGVHGERSMPIRARLHARTCPTYARHGLLRAWSDSKRV